MSSAICFNLDQSKILLSGNGSRASTVEKDQTTCFVQSGHNGNNSSERHFN